MEEVNRHAAPNIIKLLIGINIIVFKRYLGNKSDL